MIIQIYEVSNPAEAKKLAELGVDHIGVVTGKNEYPCELSFETTKKIFKELPEGVKSVALSLSSDPGIIKELVKKVNPDILHLATLPEQFSPDNVRKLKQQFPNLKIMRTIPVIDEESVKLAKEYDKIVDYLLLDTYEKKSAQLGITGKTHNWEISRKIVNSVKIPVILAGGLGPDNVAEAIQKVKPAGVDSKTKTDKLNGKGKDLKKIKEFVKIAKSFE